MLRLVATATAAALLLVAALAPNNTVMPSRVPHRTSVHHQLTRASLGLPHTVQAAARSAIVQNCGKSPQDLLQWASAIKDAYLAAGLDSSPETPKYSPEKRAAVASIARDFSCTDQDGRLACPCQSQMQAASKDAVLELVRQLRSDAFNMTPTTRFMRPNGQPQIYMGVLSSGPLPVVKYAVNHISTSKGPALSWDVLMPEAAV